MRHITSKTLHFNSSSFDVRRLYVCIRSSFEGANTAEFNSTPLQSGAQFTTINLVRIEARFPEDQETQKYI